MMLSLVMSHPQDAREYLLLTTKWAIGLAAGISLVAAAEQILAEDPAENLSARRGAAKLVGENALPHRRFVVKGRGIGADKVAFSLGIRRARQRFAAGFAHTVPALLQDRAAESAARREEKVENEVFEAHIRPLRPDERAARCTGAFCGRFRSWPARSPFRRQRQEALSRA